MNIAFTGWAGCGKTDAAKYLESKYNYNLLSFADGIKVIDREAFGKDKKVRKRLQDIGEFFRSLDSEVWVNHTVKRLEKYMDNAIDDLRRMNEYKALLEHDFFIVRIVADEDIRIKRLIERDGQCDVSLLYNESENGCADLKLYEIENDGTLEELYAKLDKLISSIN